MSVKVIEFSHYDVVVPFVCHRCGNCCRNYYPGIEMDMLPEIAYIINKPIHEIQAELGRRCDAHNAGKPMDCLFLAPEGDGCMIHAVRPDCCCMFPSLTETGIGNVDCLGYRQFDNAVKALSGHQKAAAGRKTIRLKKPGSIPEGDWERTLKTLEAAKASELLVREFMRRNIKPP